MTEQEREAIITEVIQNLQKLLPLQDESAAKEDTECSLLA